jgi:hypothetical protein
MYECELCDTVGAREFDPDLGYWLCIPCFESYNPHLVTIELNEEF